MSGTSLQKSTELTLPEARLRPALSVRRAAGLLVLLAVILGGAVAASMPGAGLVAAMGAALLLPLAAVVLWLHVKEPAGGVGLRFDREGVWMGAKLALKRGDLARAMVVVEKGVPLVLLQGQRSSRLIDVASEEQGQAVVRALGMDPTQTTSEFSFDSPVMAAVPPWAFWGYLLVPLLFLPLLAALWWLVPALMGLWYVGLLLAAVPERLTVGLDGVMARWLWRRRLIPYEEIREVESDDRAIRLRLQGGGVVGLSAYWVGQPWEQGRWKASSGFGSRKAYVDTVAARVTEAQAASQRGAEGGAAAWLSRQGQGPRAWVEALRGLLTEPRADFRTDAPEPEQLWAALEDARQPPVTRAAAAAALAPTLDEPGRGRLRVAAAAVVHPGLRVALEAASRDDDEALLSALEGLDGARGGQKAGKEG